MKTEVVLSQALGAIGAVVGGVVGFLVFRWIVSQGFYALVLPGAALGMGAALLSKHESTARGIVCGLAGLALGVFSEWKVFPFLADPSLAYFVRHLAELKPITLLMIVAGGLVGYWCGRGAGFTRSIGRTA